MAQTVRVPISLSIFYSNKVLILLDGNDGHKYLVTLSIFYSNKVLIPGAIEQDADVVTLSIFYSNKVLILTNSLFYKRE